MKIRYWLAAALMLAAPLAPAASQPRSIERPGTIAHAAADAHFPEQVGEFRRGRVVQYDAAGANLSAGYELVRPEGRMLLTVYVYPAAIVAAAPGSGQTADVARATLCRQELLAVGQAIENQPQYRGARRIEEGGAPGVEGVAGALSLRTVHSFTATMFGEGEQEVRSETLLYCYVGGRWLVKYRASAGPGLDARQALEAFVRNGPWPGRAAPPSPDETVMRVTGGRAAS